MTVATTGAEKFALRARCACPGGMLPLRAFVQAAAFLRIRCGDVVPPPVANLPVLDYRCPGCKQLVVIRLGDLLGVAA